MRIVFAGTPEFAVPCLRAAALRGEVAGVYTQPDRPAGRGRGLTASPVKLEAVQRGIPVFQPDNFRSAESKRTLRALKPDLMVVVAYGLLLPQSVLDIPEYGCWNVHASLLPRWRGAAPIQRAIMAGDKTTGVEVMRMTEGLDEGPVLASETLRIDALETAGALHDRLAVIGADLLVRTMAAIEHGEAVETPQADDGTTYAKKIRPKEARLNWTKPAAELDRKIRGLSPFPGAWFEAQTEKGPVRVKALLSRVEDAEGEPGVALDENLLIGTGVGAVRLLRVQREGKGPQEADVFLRGCAVPAGTKLG